MRKSNVMERSGESPRLQRAYAEAGMARALGRTNNLFLDALGPLLLLLKNQRLLASLVLLGISENRLDRSMIDTFGLEFNFTDEPCDIRGKTGITGTRFK